MGFILLILQLPLFAQNSKIFRVILMKFSLYIEQAFIFPKIPNWFRIFIKICPLVSKICSMEGGYSKVQNIEQLFAIIFICPQLQHFRSYMDEILIMYRRDIPLSQDAILVRRCLVVSKLCTL